MMCCWFILIKFDILVLCAKHSLGVHSSLCDGMLWWYIGQEIEADIDTILCLERLQNETNHELNRF